MRATAFRGWRPRRITGHCRRKFAGRVGEIWVSGRSKALGYWGQSDLNREIFEATIKNEHDTTKYLRTGDMGFLYQGELYICGRLKDMVVVRGINVYPTDVEVLIGDILRHTPPTRFVAFGFGAHEENDEGLVILIEGTPNSTRRNLRDIYIKLQTRMQVPVLSIAFVTRGSLSRTSSGKISRRQCRNRWRNRTIQIVDRFAPSEKREGSTLLELIEDLENDWRDRPDTTLGELGLDSMELVMLALELERFLIQKFGATQYSADALNLGMLQSLTVRNLSQIASSLGSDSPDADLINSYCREIVDSVGARDLAQMKADISLPEALIPKRGRHLPSRGTTCISYWGDGLSRFTSSGSIAANDRSKRRRSRARAR